VPVGRQQQAEAPTPSGEALRGGEHAGGFGDRTASFADIEMDDQMIEARPAEAFGGSNARKESAGVESEPFGEEEVPGFLKMRADLMGEGRAASVAAASRESEESFAPRPAFASRVADAAAADEALLDLGDIAPPGASAEADDFILDLADDSPPTAAPASSHGGAVFSESSFFDGPEFDSAASAGADAPSAFAEASHGEPAPPEPPPQRFVNTPAPAVWENSHAEAEAFTRDEPQAPRWDDDGADAFAFADEPREDEGMAVSQAGRAHEFIEPQVVPADIPAPSEVPAEFTDGSVEGDVAKSPSTPDTFDAQDAPSSATETPAAEEAASDAHEDSALRAEGGRSPEGLSPEAVDAIARRVVELMSEKVVREIAWEVVPDLAELLIKRRLDEDRRGS
jgi:hypothetical protein